MSWENNETRKDESIRQETSNLRADGDIRLAAKTGDITPKGQHWRPDRISVRDAKGDIRLESVTDSRTRRCPAINAMRRQNCSAAHNGDVTSKEQLVKTELTAGGNLRTEMPVMTSGLRRYRYTPDRIPIINTGNNLTIGTQTATQHQGHTENTTSGGIGGGSRENRATTEETAHGSDVTAGGKLWLSGGNGVTVTGSKVKRHRTVWCRPGRARW